MAEDDIYTQDGTININRKPANKEKTGNWKACWFILGNECCERLTYYGMSTNLVNYLGQRFNQGNAAAAKSFTTWSGTCYITPLLGAFLADSYLGRYWTIASFSVIYVTAIPLSSAYVMECALLLQCQQHQSYLDSDITVSSTIFSSSTFHLALSSFPVYLPVYSTIWKQQQQKEEVTRASEVIVTG